MATAAFPVSFFQGGEHRLPWTPGKATPPAFESITGPVSVKSEARGMQQSGGMNQPQSAQGGATPEGAQPPVPPASSPSAPRPAATPEQAALQAETAALNALALRCAAGDAQAWSDLARKQHRRVYGICYRFTGSQTEAEDCTQEVFLKMYRAIASFDPARGAFSTWLTTLTRNLLVDLYRRGKDDRVTDSLDEPIGGEEDASSKADRLPGSGRTQEQHVSGLELRAHIQHALQQVSPELREAVILRDLEDMDYKDIVDVLGVPTGTVKSRISRGRAELARLLKRIEGQVM